MYVGGCPYPPSNRRKGGIDRDEGQEGQEVKKIGKDEGLVKSKLTLSPLACLLSLQLLCLHFYLQLCVVSTAYAPVVRKRPQNMQQSSRMNSRRLPVTIEIHASTPRSRDFHYACNHSYPYPDLDLDHIRGHFPAMVSLMVVMLAELVIPLMTTTMMQRMNLERTSMWEVMIPLLVKIETIIAGTFALSNGDMS